MNFLKSTININERYLIAKLQKVAIRCFYLTYYRTYKNWNKPNLISQERCLSDTNDDQLRHRSYNLQRTPAELKMLEKA